MLVYLVLVVFHFKWSRREFPSLEFKGKVSKIDGLSLGIKEHVRKINDFIGDINKHNKKMSTAQFWGYLAAFVAAGASIVFLLL